MAAFAKWPWQVPCHTILLETQNLTHAEHLHLGCFRVRLPPVTSAFSLFPCNPQPKSSRQLLPSYWESHLCFAWWKETCVMTDWFGVSLLSLTVDNLHTLVLSSVWPAGSWSMLRQLVVSEESSILLVLHLCHIVNQKPSPKSKDWLSASSNEKRATSLLRMKTCNQRQQVCWQCCRVIQWFQSKSFRQFLKSGFGCTFSIGQDLWESMTTRMFGWQLSVCPSAIDLSILMQWRYHGSANPGTCSLIDSRCKACARCSKLSSKATYLLWLDLRNRRCYFSMQPRLA